jgi:16S rRNA (adenine1518-N6/adenine1519-N6)-dimethyltransferase
MQTKQHIEGLLSSAGVWPSKRLGQNFLIDLNLIRVLVDSAKISKADVVLDVGCGTGSLTEAIAERAGWCIGVEMDAGLAEIAARELEDFENVEIVSGDVLEDKHTINALVVRAIESARQKYGGRFLLVANLPYGSASAVTVNLITGQIRADAMYITVQKEVADRMTAEPGGADYGTLSIFFAATGEAKIERRLKPTVFWPPPQVESAMVSFVRDEGKAGRIRDMEIFSEVVGLFMQHRRKMLKGCVKFAAGRLVEIHNWSQIFEDSFVDARLRPAQLSAESYIAIANLCYEQEGTGK